MRKMLVFLCLVLMLQSIMAQNNQPQPEKYRYIYLWDVTLSMKGYQGKTPDIYDEVVKFLHEDIDGLPSGKNREIIVCPFQEKILATWEDFATIEGKNNLKKQISDFNNSDVTYTNLVDPLKMVEKKYVDVKNYETTIYLLTDGNQNAPNASESFKGFLDDNWDKENKFLHLKIIKLNSGILPDIKGKGNIDVLDGHEVLLQIVPVNHINYNIIEANKEGRQEIKVEFSTIPTGMKIPDGVDIHVYSDTKSIIKVDKVLPLKDGVIIIPLDYNYEELKKEYEGKREMVLYYEMPNHSTRIETVNNGKKDIYVMSLASPVTTVDVVNKPQKTLKITLR